MPKHNFEEVNVNRWWWLKRREYNIGLLLSGIISFLICGFTGAILFAGIIAYVFMFFAIAYTAYLIIANLLYTIGWVADIAFNKNNDDNFREMIFKCGYWLSVLAPPVIILLYIITVFVVMPVNYGETQVEIAKP